MQTTPANWKKAVLAWAVLSMQIQPVLAQSYSLRVPINGITSQASGTLSISPAPIIFVSGAMVGGASASTQVKVINSAFSAVRNVVVSLSSGSANFEQTNNCPSTLPGRSSCTVTLKFKPTVAGSLVGSLSVASNAVNGLQMEKIYAAASAPNLNLSVDPVPATQIGQVGTFKMRLANTSGAIVNVTPGAVSAPFAIASSTCPSGTSELSGTGSCVYTMSFSPTASGSYTTDFKATIGVKDYTYTKSVTLNGVSQLPSVALADVTFEPTASGQSSTATATLKNTGIGPIRVGNAAVSGAGFSLGTSTCSATLDTGRSCTYALSFTGSGTQSSTGALTIDTGAGVKTATLTAQSQQAILSVTPQTANFGQVQVGQTATSGTHTLTNSGNIAATNLQLSTDGAYSVLSNTCSTSLDAGASCSFSLGFAPTVAQSYVGGLSISSDTTYNAVGLTAVGLNGAGQEQSGDLSAIAFGNVAAGSTTTGSATLTNTGVGPLSIGAATVTGTGFASAAGGTCASTLAAGASCTVNVSLSASGTSAATGTLILVTGAGTKTSALSGQSQQAIVSVAPGSVNLGNVQVGQLGTSSAITVTNSGNIAATGLTFTAPTDFSITSNTCQPSLAAGGTCTFNVKFTPTVAKVYTDGVSVASATTFGSVGLNGTGVDQMAAVSTSLNFADTQVGTVSAVQTATLTNTGVGPLSVGAVTVGSNFQISNNTCSASLAAGASCTVDVVFAPTVAGSQSGVVTFATGAGNKVIALSGTGAAQAATLSAISFGNVAAGSTTTASATLTNTGVGPLSIGAATVSGTGFASAAGGTCSTTLAAGASCTVNVSLSASGTTAATGTLSLVTGAGTKTAALSGQSQQALISVTPTADSFGTVQIGQTATSGTHTVTNSGNIAATGLSVSTASAGFSVTGNTCSASLAAGGTCTFTVTFAPTAAQVYAGGVSISSGSSYTSVGVTGSVTEGGTGAAQAATLSAISFGNVAAGSTTTGSATLTNTGVGPLSIGAATVSGAGFASAAGGTCAATLAAGASCTVNVSLSASGTTAATGTLSLVTGAGTKTAALSGQSQQAIVSVSPTTDSFGTVQVGQTATSGTHTVTNSGNIAATGLSVSTASAGFSVTGNTCSASLAAGGTCTFTVTFAPTAAQVYAGGVSISSGSSYTSVGVTGSVTEGGTGAAQAATLSAISFGNVAAGSTTTGSATLTNTGVGPLSIGAATVSGAGFASAAGGTCAATLAAGASCTVNVSLSASGTTAATGTLSLVTGAGTKTAALSGQSQQAIVSVSPTTDSFGTVQVGQTATSGTHTVTNSGNIAATGLSVSTASAGFSVTGNTCSASLAAGGTCTFTVTFAPTAAQVYAGGVSISSGSSYTSVGVTGSVTEGGTGAAQAATLSAIAFGNVAAGSTTTGSATLTNTGVGPLSIGAATVSGAGFASAAGGTCAATLAAGASCTVNVSLSASGTTAATGTLSLVTGAGTKTAALSGQSQQAIVSVSPTTDSFGTVQIGQTATSGTHTVTNSGNIAATGLSVSTASAGFSVTGNTCSASLAAGGTCTFTVTFAPTAAQVYAGGVSVSSSGSYASVGTGGTGAAQQSSISASLSFPNTNTGSTSAAQSVTLTNSGIGPLSVGAASISASFGIAGNNCPASLGAGASCTVSVTFSPASAGGLSGTLTVATGAGTRTVSLSGTGVVPYFVFNPVIASNTGNFNLYAAARAAGWNGSTPLNATVTINGGGISIGSSSTSVAAFATGSGFPGGSSLTLVNYGYIVGMGGAGGNQDSAGQPGGAAMSASYPITVYNYGQIAGGGGGGGAGASWSWNGRPRSTPGSGGASSTTRALGGTGSVLSGYPSSGPYADGLYSGGGGSNNWGWGGRASSPGGAGGSWGTAGDAGGTVDGNYCRCGYAGGAGGPAVTGNGYVSWSATGTRYGALQ